MSEPVTKHDLRKSILEQIQHIVFDQLKYYPAKVYLFGSWARSEEKRSSDIDVAIEFPPGGGADHRMLMNIRNAIEESTIPYRVDVVHLNEADNYIVNKVREEGILWGDQWSE